MNNDKSKEFKGIIILLIVIIIILCMGIIILLLKNDKSTKTDEFNPNQYEKVDENTVSNSTNISQDEVINIVLKDLKLDRNNILDLDVELEYKDRYKKVVYEVSFDYSHFEYEYYVDSNTGEILDSFKSLD